MADAAPGAEANGSVEGDARREKQRLRLVCRKMKKIGSRDSLGEKETI